MAFDAKQLGARLLGEICVARAFSGNRLGVFVEDVPALDAQEFVAAIGGVKKPIRVALIGGTRVTVRAPAKVSLTTDPTVANQWRNDAEARGGTPMVVLVLGPAAKLNSLRNALTLVGASDLRDAVVARAIDLFDSAERRALWRTLRDRKGDFPTAMLLEFAAFAENAQAISVAALLEREQHGVHLLNLLRHKALFAANAPSVVRRSVLKNLDMRRRLESLNIKDRERLHTCVENGSSDEQSAARAILRYAKSRQLADLGALTFEDIDQTLRARPAKDKPADDGGEGEPDQPRRERIDGDELAAKLLLGRDSRSLGTAAKRYRAAISPSDEGDNEPEEVHVGRHTFLPRAKVGTSQGTALFGKLLSEKTWGGVISTKGHSDFVGAARLIASGNAEFHEFTPSTGKDSIRETLQRAADRALGPADALRHWDAYAAARAALLPDVAALIDHPVLAIAGDPKISARVDALLEAYGRAISAIKEAGEALRVVSPDAARRLLAHTLCVDVVFLLNEEEKSAVAAPTHPFHLYRCVAMATILRDHREEIEAIGGHETITPLLTDPIACAPHIVLSPFAAPRYVDRTIPFIATGSFGALPQFAELTARRLGKFRARSLAKVAERLIRLMPHASFGLRVAIVDPPSVAGALEDVIDLPSAFNDDAHTPIHAVVYRTREAREATDEEDEVVDALAKELRDANGSLAFEPPMGSLAEVAAALQRSSAHIAVVFDPGQGESVRIGIASPPPLSPLAISRAYRYDAFDDRLDVVVAGDSPAFAAYHDIFCEALGMPRTDFLGRRSGASEKATELGQIAQNAIWTVVVDQAVEPTLKLRLAQVLDWRTDAGRDVVTFTSHPESVKALIKDAVRAAGLVPDEETVVRTMNQLFLLSGAAVLGLARSKPGAQMADNRVAKGVLGVLAAERWYSAKHPDALVISLDEPHSQIWILGATNDNRHGDLLALRSTTDGVVIEAIEVKAHDDEEAGIKTRAGQVEGRAATQVDQTLRTLQTILALDNNSPVVRARRDVLRDQLYRAVASREYEPTQRARLVRLLEDLFTKGPVKMHGLIFRVKIEAGAPSSAPSAPSPYRSPAGNDVGLVDIVEGKAVVSVPMAAKPAAPAAPVDAPTTAPTPPAKRARRKRAADDGEPAVATVAEGKPQAKPPTPNIKVLIGVAHSGNQVYWEPGPALNNFGFLVTGDSGSGKTQILRALVSEVAASGISVCVFDNKNDYATPEFSGPAGLRVYDIDQDGLPFNPLSLVGDERGFAQPIKQVHELAGILTRVHKLGSQQEARLKAAMKLAYERRGIAPQHRIAVKEAPVAPSFGEVVGILQEDPKNEALLNRLSPLFDLNLFPDSDKVKATFEELLSSAIVLDLHNLPTDNIRSAIAEFLIVRIHSHILRGDQPRQLRRLLVFDEAWRVQESVRLQELSREGRAFGVGIAVGSQFPDDVHENLAGNLATQLLLLNQDPEHRRAVVRALLGTTSGPAAAQLLKQLGHLQKYEGFFLNQQHTPYVLLRTTPHHERSGR